MESVGQFLKNARENLSLPLQDVYNVTNIDMTLLSRIENGKRLPTKDQLSALTDLYKCDHHSATIHWLSDKIVQEVEDEQYAIEALHVASEKVQYGKPQSIVSDLLSEPYYKLESRRYIGNKAKLTPWIINAIKAVAPEATSIFDVFAGVAGVSKAAAQSFDRIIINDLLYANNLIYNAFFAKGDWDKNKVVVLMEYYNALIPNDIKENYFSNWYGGKFFDYDNAKLVGYIREDLDNRHSSLSDKEYSILLASLIYSIDKLANTVGHFDAYIKKPFTRPKLKLKLIEQVDCKSAEIFREDANQLARKVTADVAYVDPPYNSRQYSRFYHVYENLVTWNKPNLYGVALKPEPENMSVYCTTNAKTAFRDLIMHLNVKYIVVSYNNTYKSKSGSSRNKIELNEIEEIMRSRGETQILECSHKFFNAGKTDFADHKELLFITRVANE